MPEEHLPHATEARSLSDRFGLLPLTIYLTIWMLIFGRPLFGHFRDTYIGMGNDASVSMWFFVWWPYAIYHRLNPLMTDLLWAPAGINLAWTTTVPLPSLVVWPVTASAGPIAAFNALTLAALPLSAWAAFILCRHLSHRWWPALLGGYVFGFSAYMLGQQSCGHLSLTITFLVPFVVLITLRAIAGEIASAKFVLAMAALLAAQFFISIEIFATMTAAGAIALFLGWSFTPLERGRRIVKTMAPLAVAYVATAVIIGPYVYAMFAFGAPRGPIWSPDVYSTDLLNFIVPAAINQLGAIPAINRLAAPFCTYSIGEVNAYVGLPSIFLAALYAWRHWREPTGKLLIDFLIIICVMSMGPLLHFRGEVLCGLPGKVLPLIPALGKALPARLMVYAFLALAIIVSLWSANNHFNRAMRIMFAAAILIFTMPNLRASYWSHRDDSPPFFTSAMYEHLGRGENVLVLPFGIRGNSMLWQAETRMFFRMTDGYTGPLPHEFRDWPIVESFLNPVYLPARGAQLGAFMVRHRVDAIVVADRDPDAQAWHTLASSCCLSTFAAGGVTIYRAATKTLARYAAATSQEMGQQAGSALFDALLIAADRWLAAGNALDRLNPLEAQEHDLLDASWLTGPIQSGWSIRENPVADSRGRYSYGAWLGAMSDKNAGVGVYGCYPALQSILDRYRQNAERIYFPYPHELKPGFADTIADQRGLMVMEFKREQVAVAAARARTFASNHEARETLITAPDGNAKAP
jgi:hypothetical protein